MTEDFTEEELVKGIHDAVEMTLRQYEKGDGARV